MVNLISPILMAAAAFFYALAWATQFRFGWIRIAYIRKRPKFWMASFSSQHSKTIGGYKIDGFHLCQSAAICLLILVGKIGQPFTFYEFITSNKWWIDYLILGGIWMGVFERSYQWIAPQPKN